MKFELQEIEQIECSKFYGDVYDIEVEEDHSYNIDGVLVHNSVCLTRKVTGVGYPQLSAIMIACHTIRENKSSSQIIADGGLRETGDMVKGLWAGADACMIGFMLAGSSATPEIEGKKIYRGMSSRTVHGRSDIAAEGVEIDIQLKGNTEDLLQQYGKGIRSGFAMGGAWNVEELRKVEAVRVSTLTIKESEPILEIKP